MKIIGFNLIKISVERKEEIKGKLELKQNIDISNVSKEKLPFSDDEVIKIAFKFLVDYEPDFAKLILEGYVIILPEKNEAKNLLKSWKDKKIPEELRVGLFNFIMSKCNIKALNLEDELNLPLHIPMPRINPQQSN